jgi:hypothetical protein
MCAEPTAETFQYENTILEKVKTKETNKKAKKKFMNF